jgi:pimeloyl-ACP methyl ester carboxylesterase
MLDSYDGDAHKRERQDSVMPPQDIDGLIRIGMDEFTTSEIQTGETSIFVRSQGSGPPILLLHGFPQTHLMWRSVAPLLARNFAVVCADLRGYGRSGCPASDPGHTPYAKRAMAQDMVTVMERLGFPRFSVAGHDRGGRVAYRMALDHPDRVDRLAVLDARLVAGEIGAGIVVAVHRIARPVPHSCARPGCDRPPGRGRTERGVTGAVIGSADRVVCPADRVITSPGSGIGVATPPLRRRRLHLNRASSDVATEHDPPRRGPSARRAGRETRYELRTRAFAEAEAWMRAIGAMWDQRLAAFKEFVESVPSGSTGRRKR